MTQLLPSLEEIQDILHEELADIEKEILQAKKKEQGARDEKRIAELQATLTTS